MPIKPSKKVLGATQSNKLTIKDVRTKTRYWPKPYGEKENKQFPTLNYFDLIVYTGWEPWKENYKFIPLSQFWEEVRGTNKKRGLLEIQLDTFMDGYYKEVRALPLRPMIDYYSVGKDDRFFDREYENARYDEETARLKKGMEYIKKKGYTLDYDIDKQEEGTDVAIGGDYAGTYPLIVPILDNKGKELKKVVINKYASFYPLEYFIVRMGNNTITLNTRNYKSHDWLKPDTVFFFGGNKISGEKKDKDGNITKQGIRQRRALYFCRSVEIINDQNGLCQIVLERCEFWQYWGNALNSRGKAKIISSRLGMTHGHGGINEELGKHYADEATNNYQHEKYCRACDMCYDFCGDLRLKRAVPMGYNSPNLPQWQPSWKMMVVYSKADKFASVPSTALAIKNDDGSTALMCPNTVQPIRWNGGDSPWGNDPVLYYMVDSGHGFRTSNGEWNEETPISDAIHKPSNGSDYWEELPACYSLQPHLLNHSTLQCYFQKKLLFTANYKHLKIRKFPNPHVNDNDAKNSTGIVKDKLLFKLGYHIMIRSSLSGILYNFESGDIFFKWEIKVEGSEQSAGVFNKITETINKIADKLTFGSMGMLDNAQAGEASLTNPFGWITGFFKIIVDLGKAWLIKQVEPNIQNMLDPETYKKKRSLKEDKTKSTTDKNQAQAEEQTKRQKASTAKALYRAVEPSIFYSNTISMNYGFFEFGNRTISSPFMFRNEHSNLQFDNLINNVNANPIQSFDVKFRALREILCEGDYMAEVELFDFPHKGFFERILSNTTLYKDPNEYFQPWNPVFQVLQSYTHGDTSNMGVASGRDTSEEEIIKRKVKEQVRKELLKADITTANYGVSDYIGADANLWPELNRANNNCHVGAVPGGYGNCLGCLMGGGSHGNPNYYKPDRVYNFKQGGRLFLKTAGSGRQECDVPAGGGQVIFWARGNEAGFKLITEEEREITDRQMKYNFKFDKFEFQKEQEAQGQDYKQPTFEAQETDADVEVDMDIDRDKMDVDIEDDRGDFDAGGAKEAEVDDEKDMDFDKDVDLGDKDREDDHDLDNDFDIELDIDFDRTDQDVEVEKPEKEKPEQDTDDIDIGDTDKADTDFETGNG